MKKFVQHILLFTLLVFSVLLSSLFFIPDRSAQTNILAALNDKHELLAGTREKKIVFVGGSNLSFGLDSKLIAEKLGCKVINMGLHGGLGLKFMMDDSRALINSGDIIVLCPEYENFYTDNFYGEIELVSVLFDVFPEGKNCINTRQWLHLMKYLPTYSSKKIKNFLLSPFSSENERTVDIYHRNSFNSYGDACLHWNLPGQAFLNSEKISSDITVNENVFSFIKDFGEQLAGKGIKVVLLPPVIEAASFRNQESIIGSISASLKKHKMPFLSQPETFKFPRQLFFNSYYHLNKKGVDLRTRLVINQLNSLFEVNP
jgi:hypothetical protein